MELRVGFNDEEFEDQDVLRGEEAGRHLIVPYHVEVYNYTYYDTKGHQERLQAFPLSFEDHVRYPWHDQEELKFTRWVPSPVKAAFISDDVTRNEVDGHREH